MAQHNDRWASRILSLPVFDDSFAKAVQGSPFANLAFVAAMEVKTAQNGPPIWMLGSEVICSIQLSCWNSFGPWRVQLKGRSSNPRHFSWGLGFVNLPLHLSAQRQPELEEWGRSTLVVGGQ